MVQHREKFQELGEKTKIIEKASPIGQGVPMVDARMKVLGKAKFLEDLKVPNMLVGKILRSPIGHGRILRIDTRQAEKLQGVKAIVTALDAPNIKYGFGVKDQLVFARDKVRYIGDEIAAVAAVDEATAREAVDLIHVEFEELPGLFTMEEALQSTSLQIHDEFSGNVAHRTTFSRGDIEKAFSYSDVILEDTFETSRVHPSYLETQGCLAEIDPSGKVNIYAPTQVPAMARMRLSEALKWPVSKIRINQTFLGGAFGGKVWSQILPITVLLAKKSGYPVRIIFDRREDFSTAYPRVPMKIKLKMGATEEGFILGKEMEILADNGAYSVLAPAVMDTAATRVDSLYRLKNLKTDARLVYTNTVPSGMFRGFGNPQSTFAVESMIDLLASELKIDPLEMRLKNATQKGDVTAHGWNIISCELKGCLKKAADLAGYQQKKERTKVKKKKLRGIGIGSVIHVSGNRGVFPPFDGASAEIQLNENGGLTIFASDGDIGQGASTIYAQLASEVLQVPLEKIEVKRVDTDETGFGLGAYASRVTMMAGNAIRIAAENLKTLILEFVSQEKKIPQGEIFLREDAVVRKLPDGSEIVYNLEELAQKMIFSNAGGRVTAKGSFIPPGVQIADKTTKYGNISPSYSFGTHMAEVEIEQDTGVIKVVDWVAVHDSGKILNPMTAAGQVEGGVVMGIGYGLYEDLYLDSQGKVINDTFLDYKVPIMLNIPEIRVDFVEEDDPVGPFGAKSLGEPTVVPAIAAIGNAIYDATGIRLKKVPFRAEEMKKALEGKNK